MTNYEYIRVKCERYHFTAWDVDELEKCRQMLPSLNREELLSVYRNRMLGDRHPLKDAAFKILFADKIGQREKRIHNLPTDALVKEFAEKNNGNRALIRKEMRQRFWNSTPAEQNLIEQAFNASTKSDQQWVVNQKKRWR